MARCRALVVTAREEFGIAAVEAQAAGRPVIARGAGGLLENVVEGETGCWWDGGPDELAAAVAGFDPEAVDPQACVENARRFDCAIFRESFRREVDKALRDGPAERLEAWPQIPRRPALGRRPVLVRGAEPGATPGGTRALAVLRSRRPARPPAPRPARSRPASPSPSRARRGAPKRPAQRRARRCAADQAGTAGRPRPRPPPMNNSSRAVPTTPSSAAVSR